MTDDPHHDVAPFGDAERLALLDRLPEVVVVFDAETRIRWANRRTLDVLGYTLDELVGTSAFDYIHPDDVGYMLSSWEKRQEHMGEPGLITQGRARTASGHWMAFEVVGLSLLSDPAVGAMVLTARDLTHQSALADSPARMRSMIDRTTDVVLLLDGGGRIAFANRRLTALLGHDSDRVVGSDWLELVDPADRSAAARWLDRLSHSGDGATARAHIVFRGLSGERLDVDLHGTNQLSDSLIGGLIVAGRDVHELVGMQRELEERNARLAHAARHDPLTGLLNRSAFVDAVTTTIAARRAAAGTDAGDVVVLFVDLDGFKAVNDRHGHEEGDAVLRRMADRLAGAVRERDLAARYGGDEFTVLLDGHVGAPEVAALVARVGAALAEPIEVAGQAMALGASIGVGRQGVATADVDALLSEADAEMYRHKRADGAAEVVSRDGGDRSTP